MSDELPELILQLKSLRIRQARILQQLERAVAQETQVVRQIEDHTERRAVRASPRPPPPPPVAAPLDHIDNAAGFEVGDRVIIHNEVKRRKGRPPVNIYDRRAIVTGVEGDKISITTDNGFATWRLSKHLRFLA